MSSIVKPTRRELMQALGAAAGVSVGGCADDAAEQQEQQAISCFWNGERKHSMKARGAFGPIENVVVLMMENRSFDHMFGALSIPKGRIDAKGRDMGGEGRAQVHGLSGDEHNVDLDGNRIQVFRQTETYLGDITHGWDDCHKQANFSGSGNATNDGFVRVHQEDLLRGTSAKCIHPYFKRALCSEPDGPMGIYARDELPVYYALADQYALCDHWHASVLGPTWPNRFYMHLGSSHGKKGNDPVLGKRTIWEVMRDKCLTVENFFCDIPFAYVVGESVLSLGSEIGDKEFGGILQPFHKAQPGWGSFMESVKDDDLGAFTLIDPGFSGGYDDHPPCDVTMGQAFVSYVYHILKSNPKVWNKTLFVVTYDEHGGFYDHVAPPGNVPGSPQSHDEHPDFKQLGVRVPALVVGPWVKRGHVSHVQYDHCSVLSTLFDRYDLARDGEGYLNDRVRNTPTLEDCMDAERTASGLPREAAEIPQLEFSESELMDFASRPFVDGQPELARLIEQGVIPRHHDGRPFRAAAMAELLETGEQVGAFKITR